MKKTIYLYIGLPKTGTTSIQYFLYENRVELAKHGISYPLMDFNALPKKQFSSEKMDTYIKDLMPYIDFEEFSRKSLVLQEKVNARLFFCQDFDYEKKILPCFLKENAQTKQSYKERFKACFLKEIEENPLPHIILAEEAMSQHITTLPHFMEVLQEFGFDVKIIAYIRPATQWLASLWNQRTKISLTQMDFTSYCDKSYDFMVLNFLYFYVKILGKENVIIKPYEKIQWKNKDIIEDFLDIFPLSMPIENFQKKEKQNISPSHNTVELCRFLTRKGALTYNDHKQAREKLIQIDSQKMDTNATELTTVETLTDNQILEITEKTRHLYKRLASLYDKESFFIHEFPSFYGKARPLDDFITLNPQQFDIVLETLKNLDRQF